MWSSSLEKSISNTCKEARKLLNSSCFGQISPKIAPDPSRPSSRADPGVDHGGFVRRNGGDGAPNGCSGGGHAGRC